MKILSIFLVTCFFYHLASGQVSVQGQVVDAMTNETLPFANVYFVGSTIATMADENGAYSLQSAVFYDSIGFSMVGYPNVHLPLSREAEQTINGALTTHTTTLHVATVTASRKKRKKDSLAVFIWQQVMVHKSSNSIQNQPAYTCNRYSKTRFDLANANAKLGKRKIFQKEWDFVLENTYTDANGTDYLPCLLTEQLQKVYYHKSSNWHKTITIANRFSGLENQSASDFMAVQLEDIDLEKSLIILAGKTFINPFGEGARSNYRFFLQDSTIENGKKQYVLEFLGRRKQDLTFLGTAVIDSASWGIVEIHLATSPHVGMNFIENLKINQFYQQTTTGVWMKEGEELTAFISLNKKDDALKMAVTKTSVYYAMELLNPDQMDTSFTNVTTNKVIADEAFWTNARPVPLTKSAQGVYKMVETLQQTPTYKFLHWTGYAAASGYLKAGYVEFGRVPKMLSWNAIEGIRPKLRLRTTNKFSKEVQLQAYTAYGFRDQAWKYGGALRWHVQPHLKFWRLFTFHYQDDFEMLGQQSLLQTHDNIILSLTRTRPLERIMRTRDVYFSYEHELSKGFVLDWSARHKTFFAVPGVFEFTKLECAVELPHFTTTEFKMGLHWGPQEQFFKGGGGFYRFPLGSKLPVVQLDYTVGVKGILESNYNYHKLDFKLKHHLHSKIGVTKYQLHAGKVFGRAPFPLLYVHLGNEGLLYNKFAYSMMNDYEFVSDEYVAFWVDHHFDGLIWNTLPLLKKLKWRTLVSFKALAGRVAPENIALLDFPDNLSAPNFYGEFGVGVENIFKIVRVDFLWRLSQLDTPTTRKFGIKIALQPKF